MVSIVILVLLLVGILAVLSRRGGLGRTLDDQQAPGGVAPDAGRLMLYLLSLAGLMVFLFAVMGLVSIILANTVFSSRDLISANEAREQGSYYLAALIVATPLWLSFWRVIRSRIARRPEEGDAPERCLFFGIVLMATSIVALGGIHTLLRVVFTLPDVHDSDAALKDGAQSFIQLLVYGGALLVSVRTAWRERGITERDPARDLGLYALTLYALGFLTVGLLNALAVVIAQLFHLDR